MKTIYQFLRQYNIGDPQKTNDVLKIFSDRRLTQFAERYIEFANSIPLPKRADLGMVDLYPDSASSPIPIDLIKHFAIYVKKLYIHDPILNLSMQWIRRNFAIPYMHMKESERSESFKQDLSRTIQYILYLRPLIESNIIVLTPLAIDTNIDDVKNIYIKDFYSPTGKLVEDNFVIPQPLMEYCQGSLKGYYGRIENGQLVPTSDEIDLQTNPLPTSDKICLHFGDDPYFWPFHISTRMEVVDEEQHRVRMFLDFRDDVSIDEDMFINWVNDKRKDVIKKRINGLTTDITYSEMLGATYITNLRVSHDLAIADMDSKQGKVLTALMNLDLPYFENASPESIAQARKHEGNFTEFVTLLEQNFGNLEINAQSPDYQQRIDEMGKDVFSAPIIKIEQKMKELKGNIFRDSGLLTLGTLMATFTLFGLNLHTQAITTFLGGTTLSMGKIRKNREERQKIQEMPAFFYWDTTRKKK